MIEINVNVRCPDLANLLDLIYSREQAITGGKLSQSGQPILNDLVNRSTSKPILNDLVNRSDQSEVSNATPPAAPVLPTTVVSGPDVPKAALAPEPVAPVEPPKAPTEAPSFTLAQVARAGADLLTAKPALQGQLLDLLGKYGASTVVELKPEHFGAFAAELRKMGAKI